MNRNELFAATGVRGALEIILATTILLLLASGIPAQTLGLLDAYPSPIEFSATSGVWEQGWNAPARLAAGVPEDFNAVRLNRKALESALAYAPHESLVPLGQSQTIFELPMPDGKLARFRFQDAPVLEPDFAAKFPEIKSYRVLGVDDATVTGRVDLSPHGLHATLVKNDDLVTIVRASDDDPTLYASYGDDSFDPAEARATCGLTKTRLEKDDHKEIADAPRVASGNVLRTYRMALATTWEFSNEAGGTTAGTVAALNSWVSALNAIYEREVSIRFLLVNSVNAIYSTDRNFTATTDPFTDNESQRLIEEVKTVLRQQIGDANFNIGHVIAFGASGGLGSLGSVCGEDKAGGISPLRLPAGNAGGLKLFAHEIGHQFSAPHSFNGLDGNCGTNRMPEGSVEPGAGTTIMSYRGNCGTDNNTAPALNSQRFHAATIQQITDFVVQGRGSACPIVSQTGNTPPTVNAPAAINIPRNTPFQLTASGSDPDGVDASSLTFVWEQIDVGGTFSNGPYNDQNDPPNTTRPLFRSFDPSKNPTRVFPSLKYILNNANNVPESEGNERPAESLPRIGRSMRFRVTARDNVGGVNDATTTLTVDGNSGPFLVTAPNAALTWTGGSTQAVTWNVANTTAAPVSAANVKITLSTDGGQTFPIVLAETTPNSGTANVTVPNGINVTTARVKVEAVGNIFFDISDANFTIVPGNGCPVVADISPRTVAVGNQVIITGINFTGVTAVTFPNNVAATFTINSDTQITATVPAGAVGGAVTITKPGGCAVVQTAEVTICPGTPATLQVDNGTPGGTGGTGRADITEWAVNRLTPASYPATISSVTIVVADNMPAGTPINIVVGSNLGGTANIDNAPIQIYPRTVTAPGQPATYNVPSTTITSGDFIVGYNYTNGLSGTMFDNAANSQNRSYTSPDGVTFIQRNDNVMIRANVYTGVCTPGAPCSLTISANNVNIAAAGGNGSFNIAASGPNCPWTVSRGASWVTLTSPTTGTGNAPVNFTVAPNDSNVPRSATITVGDKTFTINQAAGTGPTCIYNLSSAGGEGYFSGPRTGITFDIQTTPGCAWTAATSETWITFTSATTGAGTAAITFNISANPTANLRRAVITVAGLRYGFSQLGSNNPCVYQLPATSATISGAASTGLGFAVTTRDDCQWTATTADNWLTLTAPTGTGNGNVGYSAAANPSSTNPRVGTITVGGVAFQVTQQPAAPANCAFAFATPSVNVPATASTGNIASVTTTAGCPWTASTPDNWITITGGAAGTGNGTITFSVAANPAAARVGTITVGGQTFRVEQAAAALPCTPITGGLANWYRGESNMLDSIAGNNGQASGNLQYFNAQTGQGFGLNGTDASVTIQRQIADDFTIEFWVMAPTESTGGTNQTDWRQGAGIVGTSNNDFGVSIGNGRLMFGVGDTTVTSANAINDGFFYHVVATRNRASGALSLYIDGAPAGTATGPTTTLNTAPQIIIGRRGTAGAFFNGTVDELKIYNVELTAAQARTANAGCTAAPRAVVENTIIREGDPNGNAIQSATFTVRLSSPATTDVAINYETEDGTAVDGEDYDGVSGTVIIPAGSSVGTIEVPVYGDDVEESDCYFFVQLIDSDNVAIGDAEAVGTIIDDDSSCDSLLGAPGRNFTAAASAGNSFTLQTGAGCGWSAASASPWITVTSSGTGNGSVTYAVAENTGSGRTGYITVAGNLFTVFQAASANAPTYAVSGRVANFDGVGIPNSIVVLTDQSGITRSTRTNAFGNYRFTGIAAGQTCVVTVRAGKEYRFSSSAQTISVVGDYEGVNFLADN